MLKMPLKFSSLFIVAVFAVSVSGQTCKLPSGEIGLCREKNDCYGSPQSNTCQGALVCCTNHGKSEKKCKEYGKYVYSESYSEALTVRALLHKVSECRIEAVPLIVGGTRAQMKEFPHMAAIGYGKSIERAFWLCGGSLISENYVLTAAHCASADPLGPAKFVKLGILNVKNDLTNGQQISTVEKVIVHPKYDPQSQYNDIALCKLSDPVKLNGFVRPACLHTSYDEMSLKKAIASGWGKTDYSARTGSEELLKVTLNMIDRDICNAFYEADTLDVLSLKGILPSQVCAGEMSGGKDTCQGDSGGPLQTVSKSVHCMYEVVGITSFGKFCGFKNSPAVYSRVSYYVPWIESIVWP